MIICCTGIRVEPQRHEIYRAARRKQIIPLPGVLPWLKAAS